MSLYFLRNPLYLGVTFIHKMQSLYPKYWIIFNTFWQVDILVQLLPPSSYEKINLAKFTLWGACFLSQFCLQSFCCVAVGLLCATQGLVWDSVMLEVLVQLPRPSWYQFGSLLCSWGLRLRPVGVHALETPYPAHSPSGFPICSPTHRAPFFGSLWPERPDFHRGLASLLLLHPTVLQLRPALPAQLRDRRRKR